MQHNHFTIYVLIDPRDHEIRYVGQTSRTLPQRLAEHCRGNGGGGSVIKRSWFDELERYGLAPECRAVQVLPISAWGSAERYWISHFRAIGCALLNRANGQSNDARSRRDWDRSGDVLGMPLDLQERFWRFVQIKSVDECHEWIGGHTAAGYGLFSIRGRGKFYAHRLIIGADPRDTVLHTCDNRACVNPRHLIRSDNSANMRDCVSKGRHVTPWKRAGEASSGAKLTERQVKEILGSPLRECELGRIYGVSRGAIAGIRTRRTWRHVSVGAEA
jgi:hypothetical protein